MQKNIPIIEYPNRDFISSIKVFDNKEPLVDILETGRIFLRKDSKFLLPKLRQSVYERLIKASDNLPNGYNFMVMSAYIPLSLQQDVWNGKWEKVSKRYWYIWFLLPRKIKERLVRKYAAYPKKGSPHSTGGAVDVILVDDSGKEIDVGGKFASADKTAHTRYEDLNNTQKQNRAIIYNAMIDSGFVNQPFEWWHYSYGDKTWAALNKKDFAIYDTI